jgi:hypothetical protein
MGKSATHMVSAWASENGIVLGQIKTDDKERSLLEKEHKIRERERVGITII